MGQRVQAGLGCSAACKALWNVPASGGGAAVATWRGCRPWEMQLVQAVNAWYHELENAETWHCRRARGLRSGSHPLGGVVLGARGSLSKARGVKCVW